MRIAVVVALGIVGCAFALTGAVGMLRMADFYLRVLCSTLIGTFGLLPLLIALVVAKGPLTSYGGRALIVAFLSVVLGPAAGHALARSARRAGVPVHPGSGVHEKHAPPTDHGA